jgi:high-affinity iron transporter
LDIDFFTSGFLTGLRQAIGPALAVSLILAYLAKTGNERHFDKIWISIGVATVLSTGAGVLLWISIGDFRLSGWSMGTDGGSAEDLFDAITMLVGATVLTWMLFWMRRTAADIASGQETRVDSVLVEGSIFGLAILAFSEIIRQGVETAWFLISQVTAAEQEVGASGVVSGAVIGISIAMLIGLGFYRAARLIDRRTFFVAAGVVLIVIAAGLLSHAVREFILAGWVTVGVATAFDISAVLPHQSTDANGLAGAIGSVLRALFGYSSRPEWITFGTWLAYIVVAMTSYLRPMRRAPSEARSAGTRSRVSSGPSSQDLASHVTFEPGRLYG